jgi:hypothetical protein
MGFCLSGIESTLTKNTTVSVNVKVTHPLILLMNALNWSALFKIVEDDLKRSTNKLKWWVGRKLKVRTHLGVFLLQTLYNETDRGIEQRVKDDAVFAVFSGKLFVKKWRVPDHTKIAEFRSRLKPETQCALANEITKLASRHGFANVAHVDIDSTVQRPDMQHPASVNLLIKTASLGRRVQKLLFKKIPDVVKDKMPDIDMKKIKGIAKEHCFEKRKDFKKKVENRKVALAKLWTSVSEASQSVIRFGRLLMEPFLFESLNKRDKQALKSYIIKAPALLTDLFEHCYDHEKRRANVFSFNREDVLLFNKNKHHKGLEFGRQFQIGRVEGNFLFSIPNDNLRMNDPESFKKVLKGHIETFKTPMKSITTDKGYYSKDNERLALGFGIDKVAVQRPNRKLKDAPDNPISKEDQEALYNRRSGIEPLIGHLKKHFQMGRSRAKTDQNTESSGFASILGFNLRQMMRYLTGEATPIASG